MQRIVLIDLAPHCPPRVVGDELIAVVVEDDAVVARLQLRLLARVVDEGQQAVAFLLQVPIPAGQVDRQQHARRDDPDDHHDDHDLDQREAARSGSVSGGAHELLLVADVPVADVGIRAFAAGLAVRAERVQVIFLAVRAGIAY